jgi:hypothetical protein
MAESVTGLFADAGFTVWGGYWDTPIDYQHFQFSREFAEKLAALPEAQARRLYLKHLGKLESCLQAKSKGVARRPGTTCALD